MANQIVQQPDGRFAIWSTIVDDFTVVDCENAAEIVDVLTEWERTNIVRQVHKTLDAFKRHGRPYHQHTKSFAECVAIIRDRHGDDAESLRMLGLSQP